MSVRLPAAPPERAGLPPCPRTLHRCRPTLPDLAADAMPIEIVQFCHDYTLKRLESLPEVAGAKAKLRMSGAMLVPAPGSRCMGWQLARSVRKLGLQTRSDRAVPPPLPGHALAGDKPYVTDNHNFIVDLYFDEPMTDAYAGGAM